MSRFFQKLIAPVPVSALQKVLPEMTRGEAAGVMLTYGTLGQYEDARSGLATVAAFHIEAGSRRFADFSWRMVTDIGEQISPYLEYLYARGMAELVIAINHGILSDDDVNEFYARGFESHGPSRREKIVERLKRRIKTGGTVADLNRYVQHLQLLAIENGVTDINQAIDEVHGQVRTLVPDLGRLETRDAMSGHRPLRKCTIDGDPLWLGQGQAAFQDAPKNPSTPQPTVGAKMVARGLAKLASMRAWENALAKQRPQRD